MKNNLKLKTGTSNASTTNGFSIGLDFILCHFQDPIWPRAISTAASHGAQFYVYSKDEAVQKFRAA